jgi:hypothetical protein
LALTACAPEVATFPRPLSHDVEAGITNALPTVVQVTSGFLPQPWSAILQGLSGLALAALAFWQKFTHSRVDALVKVAEALATKQKP